MGFKLLIFLFCLPLFAFPNQVTIPAEVSVYLPQPNELPGWETDGSPQYARGEDLFILIDGGAEIYHEYGFEQAIIQGYRHKSQPQLNFNLELYIMKDTEAAYGIYTFKSGHAGHPCHIGDDARLEDYYLNFRKGRVVGTLIGFNTNPQIFEALQKTAQLVAAKIKENGQVPDLVRYLPSNPSLPLLDNGIEWIAGYLALANHYTFDSKDIFAVHRGVIGKYKDLEIMIFQYQSPEQCQKQLITAAHFFQTNTRFSDFSRQSKQFSMKDEHGKPFLVQCRHRYILIVCGLEKSCALEIIEKYLLPQIPEKD